METTTTAERNLVCVIDDDPNVLEWIRVITETIHLEARTYASPSEFLAEFDPERTGCVITDLRMPRMSGLELQSRMRELAPDVPLIVMSAHGEVSAAVRAMKRGAIDFLEKPFAAQDLIDCINEATTLAEQARADRQRNADTTTRFESLTERERETLLAVVQGMSNKEIAHQIGISDKTVEDRRARVMRKMNASSVAELTRRIIEAGLMPRRHA